MTLIARTISLLGTALAAGLWATGLSLAQASGAAPSLPKDVFATVGNDTISAREFNGYLRRYARTKLYHGSSPEQLAELKEEAAEKLVERQLLLQEAERRGIEADTESVEQRIQALEDRYGNDPNWEEISKTQIPQIRELLQVESKVGKLQEAMMTVDDPDETTLKAFYDANIPLFTEPAASHVSAIIINVPPWESSEVWKAAEQRAQELHDRIADGADFAEVARENSTHESAPNGGDLGFIHEGGFSETAQEAISTLEPGKMTAPVRLLEGYGVFRLNEIRPSRVRDYAEVTERATALYKRKRSEQQWQDLISSLRASTTIVVNQALLEGGEDTDETPDE